MSEQNKQKNNAGGKRHVVSEILHTQVFPLLSRLFFFIFLTNPRPSRTPWCNVGTRLSVSSSSRLPPPSLRSLSVCDYPRLLLPLSRVARWATVGRWLAPVCSVMSDGGTAQCRITGGYRDPDWRVLEESLKRRQFFLLDCKRWSFICRLCDCVCINTTM